MHYRAVILQADRWADARWFVSPALSLVLSLPWWDIYAFGVYIRMADGPAFPSLMAVRATLQTVRFGSMMFYTDCLIWQR